MRLLPTLSARRILRPVAFTAALLLSAGHAIAQDEAPRQFMVFEHWGMPNLVSDPRDAGLKRAIEMLPARLNELREEIPGLPPEVVTLMDMLPRMISRPMKMGIAYTPGEPTGGLFNYGIVISIEAADEAEAKRNHERIKSLLKNAEAPTSESKRLEGFTEIQVGPPGNLAYGVRKSGNAWRNEVVYGTVGDLDKVLASPAVINKNVKPLMVASFDLTALTPAEKMILTVAPKEQPEIREIAVQLRKNGLLGNDAMKANLEVGVTADEMITTTRVERAGKFKAALHMAGEPLTEADFRAIPADASMASIGAGDLGYFRDAIDQASKASPEVQSVIDQFKEQTGVDIRTDIIDCVGGSFAMYMSDSTGGGGLGSAVVLIGLRDRERFMKAHAKLVGKARQLIDENLTEMPGPYLKLDTWKDGTTDMNALRMRGLPMPIELCYAATSRYLILGLTPQAVTAAVRQAEGKGDGGILTNPRVAEVAKARQGSLLSLSYSDTPRMVREGYTLLAMLGTGIANGVRSTTDYAREPGLVVPPPHDLLKNAKASVSMSYWDGETLVMESKADKSLVVAAGGTIGTVVQFAPLIAGVAGGVAAAQNAGGMAGPFGLLEVPNNALPLAVPHAGPAARFLAMFQPWWQQPMGPARALVLADDLRASPLRQFAPMIVP